MIRMRNRAREISGGLKSTTESTTRSVLEILKIRISMHRIEGLQLLLVIFEPELAWAVVIGQGGERGEAFVEHFVINHFRPEAHPPGYIISGLCDPRGIP